MNDLTMPTPHFGRAASCASHVLTAFPGTPVSIVQVSEAPSWETRVGPAALGGWVWPKPGRRELVVAMIARHQKEL